MSLKENFSHINMAETTTSLRLMAAAKEFNVGKDTLVDFLVAKGFNKDDLKPTSKLTEDMYRSLQQEFQGDKVAKIKSDQIDLPKGSLEAKKKKEDEAIIFKKDIKKIIKEEAPVEELPKPPVIELKKEPELVKIEVPEIEAPKIMDKIDLSAIDSSTRPKKVVKKKEPAPEEQDVEVKIQGEESPVIEAERTPEEPGTEEQEEGAMIENIKADKIEGPKILGKIELPPNSDTRP